MEHELTSKGAFASPLVVSALPAEQAALRARLGVSTRSHRWSLRRGDRHVHGVVTGDGAQRAKEGLEAALRAVEPTSLWVLGVGGGLSPDLESGDLVASVRILDAEDPEFSMDTPPLEVAGARPGTFVTVSGIVDRADDKRALWRAAGCPGAAVVDLESAVYARLGRDLGIPVFGLRVVSDAVGETLPPIIKSSVDPAGSVRPLRVALGSALRPATWPQLAVLGRRLQAAAHRLAEAVDPLLHP